MARVHEEYKAKGVEVLALNVIPQYSTAEFLSYMKKYKGGEHLYATDAGQRIAAAYGVNFLGETVFIDRDGKITSRAFPPGLSYEELKSIIEPLSG